MKILKENKYAEGTVIIQLAQLDGKYLVRAINKVHNKTLDKEFNSQAEAERFFNFVKEQQDSYKP
jgi:hypothetical protein